MGNQKDPSENGNYKKHRIRSVLVGSIAEELGVEAGDALLGIGRGTGDVANGEAAPDGEIEDGGVADDATSGVEILPVEDIFDYQYLTQEEELTILLEKADGEEWLLEVEKDADEDLGLVFESGLMDEYRSCRNRCIFCFIDQMPPGMRETLYFKDDDSRLSFLQGNYVTLTNLSEKDLDRIIRYRLSPINVSVHTTEPDLRCRMLQSRFAGEALGAMERLFEAGIEMNAQIVLCKGWNDGAHLERTIEDLMRYLPVLRSVSVVPVGLTKFREGLAPLEPFSPEDALSVLETIHRYQGAAYARSGLHFIHASDEWYLNAGLDVPEAERYDGYLQLENGVGMVRILKDEFEAAFAERVRREEERGKSGDRAESGAADAQDGEQAGTGTTQAPVREISLVTGVLAAGVLGELCGRVTDRWNRVRIHLYPIRNDFFGERITVSGLLTGRDILAQLSGKELGEALYLPENVLRAGEEVFLDDLTRTELSSALQVPVHTVKLGGSELLSALLGTEG